ncbi:MAG TPA: hypothetical protein ENJ95_17010 [Bacteroidetes bacterium]|nr:hypothetical protein [Bacteroidota bacterium]
MKKTILFFAFAFFAFAFKADAQNYQSAVGARFGYPLSASLKHFLNDSHALEGYIGTRGYSGYRWTNISAAYQIHNPIPSVDGLQYYYGAGLSIFFWNYENNFRDPGSNTSFGLQGYLGLDYTFADVPVSLTLDWVPTYFLNGFGDGFGGGFGSLGVRYIFSE